MHPANAAVSMAGVNGGTGSFADIADRLNRSVVHITTTSERSDPFSLFFGNGSQQVTGIGTGMIVSSDGYILTNYHVVGEASKITVKVLQDKDLQPKEYAAKLIGGDKQEDLAVIKIDAQNLPPVTFGDSETLRPGDAVMAIVNPYGFEHTVSVGVVSALNRNLPVEETVTLKHMIQTDASINPGNSGGPLVNTLGQVIGINSAIYVGGGNGPQAKGIGFAIPSNHAMKIMEALRNQKKIPHPYIGISYEPLSDDLRQQKHLPNVSGMIVQDVLTAGPAAKGGVRKEDIITAVDGKNVTDQSMLSDYISSRNVGDNITLTVLRYSLGNGQWQNQDMRVKVEDKPGDYEQRIKQQFGGNRQAQPDPDEDQAPQNKRGGGGSFPFSFPF